MRLNRIIKIVFTVVAIAITALTSSAQEELPASRGMTVGLKSNLLSDVALSPNIGVELELTPKWTLDISAQANLWTVDSRKWKHAFIQPEARYWFCESFAGHFLGVHAIGGAYNFGNLNLPFKMLGSDLRELKDKRYQGWAAGLGVAYGYAWPVAKHWNVEAEIGVGWMYTRFDSYPCAKCGSKLQENHPHNYVGPTKLAVNIEYLF